MYRLSDSDRVEAQNTRVEGHRPLRVLFFSYTGILHLGDAVLYESSPHDTEYLQTRQDGRNDPRM